MERKRSSRYYAVYKIYNENYHSIRPTPTFTRRSDSKEAAFLLAEKWVNSVQAKMGQITTINVVFVNRNHRLLIGRWRIGEPRLSRAE